MKEHSFELTLMISVLLSHILILSGCAPTKVQIYRKETPPEKATSRKTASEQTGQEITGVKPTPQETYDETISGWKSYEDVVKWMTNDFSFDKERYEKFEGTLPVPRTPQETFQLKSGIYIDAAMFLKETLNRVNPSYKALIVILMTRPSGFNHYACSLKKDGKIFIMDYGTPYKEVTGIHGPYSTLEEYRTFYQKHLPIKREIEAITYLP